MDCWQLLRFQFRQHIRNQGRELAALICADLDEAHSPWFDAPLVKRTPKCVHLGGRVVVTFLEVALARYAASHEHTVYSVGQRKVDEVGIDTS